VRKTDTVRGVRGIVRFKQRDEQSTFIESWWRSELDISHSLSQPGRIQRFLIKSYNGGLKAEPPEAEPQRGPGAEP